MNDFRDRLIYLLQTVGQLEGRADDVADAIIENFDFNEEEGWHVLRPEDTRMVVGWMSDD